MKLTEKELQALKANMSKKEKKEFERRQKQAEKDRFFDALLLSELWED